MKTLSRRTTLSILAAFAAAPRSIAQESGPPGPPPGPMMRRAPMGPPPDPATLRASMAAAAAEDGPIASYLDELAAGGGFSGAALIAVEGRPPLRRVYGMADRTRGVENTFETRFNTASVGKMFTAVALGQLAQQGRLSFQDPVSRHLPDVAPAIAEGVTLHHLLTHTSGLGMYWGTETYQRTRMQIRTVADYMATIDPVLAFAPGERFSYSNSGYIVLGAVIERITGRDFYDLLKEAVFDRAGMARTDYATLDQIDARYARADGNTCTNAAGCGGGQDPLRGGPAGGAYSTVDDLLKFQTALQGGVLLDAATLREMTTPKVTPPRPGPPPLGYGFGIETMRGLRIAGHTGGTPGFGALLDMYLDVPATVALTSNMDRAVMGAARGIRPLLIG